jgi:hypothetical protein
MNREITKIPFWMVSADLVRQCYKKASWLYKHGESSLTGAFFLWPQVGDKLIRLVLFYFF